METGMVAQFDFGCNVTEFIPAVRLEA